MPARFVALQQRVMADYIKMVYDIIPTGEREENFMKKSIALLLILILILMLTATSCGKKADTDPADETAAETAAAESYDELTAHMDEVLEQQRYQGIVCLTRYGEVIYQRATGEDEEGNPLTADTSIYIGSTSKQFCAAAVMLLRDQGKLSVDDTIDKYFPEYESGRKITIKNLLTMRSGIRDMVNQGNPDEMEIGPEKSEKDNIAGLNKWIFNEPLLFEPDTAYAYSNSNFLLLSEIVEQVSGQYYNDFIREKIFEPLGMSHSGFITEVGDHPAWAENMVHDDTVRELSVKGIARGAGDVIISAPDMAKWMEGLISGKVVGMDTYREMTTDYSPDNGEKYGYGLMLYFAGGAGHPGRISFYSAVNYFNPDNGFCLFCDSNTDISDDLPVLLLDDYLSDK